MTKRTYKLPLSLSETEKKRLKHLVMSYRATGVNVTMSDVLRQGLFCLERQQPLPFIADPPGSATVSPRKRVFAGSTT